ncbi:hypothetical protein [Amycolatopsis sp. PS_44_ISF1]|uniref:hypothetical protein n=1 Tax=Amycolatopsis sp. PS_44_ISF1 TaxID=2974917 RepID=UPI0028DEEA4C|nr:hypothetical protein [Amycolatopsis sp. PS_44_ISF1]MDT8914654.1 hypothetical protein [Amycolatopsis sp. PS_44_ISF1]
MLLLVAGGLLIIGAFFDLGTISLTLGHSEVAYHVTAWSTGMRNTPFSIPRYFGGPLSHPDTAAGPDIVVHQLPHDDPVPR